MHRLMYGTLLLLIALAGAAVIITGHVVSWFNLGVIVILFAKGLFWARSRSKRQSDSEQRNRFNFTILASGYSIAAILFLCSAIVGEGWFGFVAAPVFASSAIVMTVAPRIASKQQTVGQQG